MARIYARYRAVFLLPILTTTIAIIVLLLTFDISYDTYMLGGKWIDALLGPAVVALAIPLYKQRDLLKNNLIPIIGGIFVGSVTAMSSGILFTQLFGFSKQIVLTFLPKSITTPIAMQITSEIGGIPSLAAVFVIIAGLTGAMFADILYKPFHIDTAIGRGIGLGAASHAIGTSKAIEYGEQDASMSSIAMTLSALFGSFLGPIAAMIFY